MVRDEKQYDKIRTRLLGVANHYFFETKTDKELLRLSGFGYQGLLYLRKIYARKPDGTLKDWRELQLKGKSE